MTIREQNFKILAEARKPFVTNFYQRERSKYQQASTEAPCCNCGTKPAESIHLIDWLTLKKAGFPASLISGEWNLQPLCRPCHWLYDGREDIWVGHYLREEGIGNKKDRLLSEFIDCLSKKGIKARLPLDGDNYDDELYAPSKMEDVDIWGGRGSGNENGEYVGILVTKIGKVVVEGLGCYETEVEADAEKAEVKRAWKYARSKLGIKTSAEYRESRDSLLKEYQAKREKILEILNPKRDEALKIGEELRKSHLLQAYLKIGEYWSEQEQEKITGFDISHLREDGMISVFIWREPEIVKV